MTDKAKGFEKRNPCLDWRSRRLHLSPPPWLSLHFLASVLSLPHLHIPHPLGGDYVFQWLEAAIFIDLVLHVTTLRGMMGPPC